MRGPGLDRYGFYAPPGAARTTEWATAWTYHSGGGGSTVDLEGLVPMHWPSGPLEIDKGRRREVFTAREAETLRAWSEPGALELLAGSPVNCLIVPWAEGSARDASQQRALAPLVAAAVRRGLSVVGWVASGADLRQAALTGRDSGLAALATDSREPVTGFDVLRFRKRGFGDASRTAFLGDLDAVWPGMRPLKVERGVDAVTGATSRPWIDSNVWYVRLARSLLAPMDVWLAFDPPGRGEPLPADAYRQAIADSEIGGARWVVSLDASLRFGLMEDRAAARETWAAIGRSIAFFRRHQAWAKYAPVGQIGVVSDFAGANEFLSFEVLNLLARRSSLFRVLDKGRVSEAALAGLDAVLYVDEAAPGPEVVRTLDAFAEKGGTLITPPGWGARGVPDGRAGHPRFRIFRHGRGRLAIAREEPADPDLLAEDAELLTSHRLDRVRAFNLGTGQLHYATSTDGRQGVLHVLAFPTPFARGPMTVWFRQPWTAARSFTIDTEEAAPAGRTVTEGGVEFHLPPVPVYCALEVSG